MFLLCAEELGEDDILVYKMLKQKERNFRRSAF
jgi:hypothetical protein